MRDDRKFQRRDFFTTTNKVPWTASMAQNSPPNYVNNYETDFYHSQIKPLLLLLRLMGALPIEIRKSGAPSFSLLSPVVAYTVCFIVLITVSAYCNITDRMASFHDRRDFDFKIYTTLHIYASGCSMTGPISMLLDTKKLVHYTCEWVQFQTLFLQVTAQRLVPSVRKRCVCFAVLCVLVPMGGISFHFYEPFISIWAVPSYVFATALPMTFVSYWILTFRSLIIAGTSFSTCLKDNLEQGNLSAEIVGEYRVLWLRLSELVSGMGVATECTLALYMVHMLFGFVLSLYGLLFGINTGHQNRLLLMLFIVFIIILIALQFYFLCSHADVVMRIVRTDVQRQLHAIKTWHLREDVKQEVNMFLRTILMNPPVISALGFSNLNRRLFASYASALLTYLIVLMQFKG